jgi:Lon protease-like protein
MTNFVPIFPLSIVVYPGENLNLHIFEPKYKQLIQFCHAEKKPFGIPAVVDNKMQDHGTLMQIKEISKVHENGEMDIKTEGEKVFRVLEVIREVPDKLYCGAIVNYPMNYNSGSAEVMSRVVNSIRELYELLHVEKKFGKEDELLNSYDVAHHIGMSIQEEYELLSLMHERQRQEYLKRHLAKVIPLLAEMESLKIKVKLNGHFKNLSSFNFDL